MIVSDFDKLEVVGALFSYDPLVITIGRYCFKLGSSGGVGELVTVGVGVWVAVGVLEAVGVGVFVAVGVFNAVGVGV
jgi:hypothetical protein